MRESVINTIYVFEQIIGRVGIFILYYIRYIYITVIYVDNTYTYIYIYMMLHTSIITYVCFYWSSIHFQAYLNELIIPIYIYVYLFFFK